MQQMTGVAVLATHLAETDRRALSQAWYDALHLAGRTPQPSLPAPRVHSRSIDLTPPHGSVRGDTARRASGTGAPLAGRSERPSRFETEFIPERRAPKSELARRIEHALARRTARTALASSSFSLHAAGGRVRILVRSDGARLRVVAVCAPPLRERVERALAQARFALASRGIRAEAG